MNHHLNINKLFLYEVAETVIETSKSAYPELEEKKDYIKKIIETEEKRFSETINDGLAILETYIAELKEEGKTELSGDKAFKLYDTYGTFGQFVNIETGEMVVGCSTSATIGCGALVSAYRYFNDDRYLKTAKSALGHYYNFFIDKGYTNGGPGEILSAPDSESAFGLLESCVVMYECDRDKIWLDMAETIACYCSSWVMSYAYKFPEMSEFYRLGINTTGSVFANVQNKHSAPGICTLSGDSLLKLYKYTNNTEYLDLIKDIAYYIPQSVSTEEKPIYSWDNPRQKLAPGYICERVNTSDWEYPKIGEVWNGSCWCETSLLLSFAELMTDEDMI